MRNTFLTLFIFILLLSIQANSAFTDSLKVNLTEVDITARRNLIAVAREKMVHQITKDEIKLIPVAAIDGLLDQLAGVDIRSRGFNGTQADISLRGGTFDQVIVLLNGINITDPQTGHYNLDLPVDISNIERIEIIQGAQALLMGINPFSGAVNIVTNQNSENNVSVKLSGGSYNTFSQNISAFIKGRRIETSLSATNNSSDGYKPNTDYSMKDAYLQTVFRTSNAGKFDLQLAYQQKNYGAHGFYSLRFPDQYDNTRTLYGALNWNYKKDNMQFQTHAYYRGHTDKFELFRYPEKTPAWYSGHNYHLTNTSGIKLNINTQLGYGKLTAGAEIRNENILSNVLGQNSGVNVKALFEENAYYTKYDNRLIATIFGGIEQKIDNWDIAGGAVLAHTERFGMNWSGALNIGYNISDNVKIYISGNRAFRLPTFTDLYYKSVSQRSNPALKPEYATTYESGLKINHKNLNFNISGFYRSGTNLIDWIKYPDSTVWISSNLSKVNALGGELSASYNFRNIFIDKISLSYSIMNMTKPNTPFISKYVLDYLRHKVNVSFQHTVYKNLKANWQGGFYDRAGEYILAQGSAPQSYQPAFVADFRLMWKLKKMEFFADVRNFTNTQYADFGGLMQPGINFHAGISVFTFGK